MITETTGDLIAMARAGRFTVIAHGCNCFCRMGAGLARSIKQAFPEAAAADAATAVGDRSKLGTCSVAVVRIDDLGPSTAALREGIVDMMETNLTIVNAYTQYGYSCQTISVDYGAVRRCMRWIAETYPDADIGLPLIGAGLARGDWGVIREIIEEELRDCRVTIVRFDGTA